MDVNMGPFGNHGTLGWSLIGCCRFPTGPSYLDTPGMEWWGRAYTFSPSFSGKQRWLTANCGYYCFPCLLFQHRTCWLRGPVDNDRGARPKTFIWQKQTKLPQSLRHTRLTNFDRLSVAQQLDDGYRIGILCVVLFSLSLASVRLNLNIQPKTMKW